MRKILATVLLVCMMVTLIPLQALAFEIPSKVSDIKQEDIIGRVQDKILISDGLYELSERGNSGYYQGISLTKQLRKIPNNIGGYDKADDVYREKGYVIRHFKWNETKNKLVAVAPNIVSDFFNRPLERIVINGEEYILPVDLHAERNKEIKEEIESKRRENSGYYTEIYVKEPQFDDISYEVPTYYLNGDYSGTTTENGNIEIYHINRAVGLGLINGTKVEDKLYFEPDEAISKSEYYTIIAKIFGAVSEGNSKMYDILNFRTIDEANIILDGLDYNLAEWAKPYVSALYEKGFITEEDFKDDNFTNEQIDVLEKMFLDVEDNQIYKEAFDYFGTIRSEGIENNRNEIVKMIVDVLEKFEW
jgi:hypothetical protein